ncbi:hypothetical protein BH10ACT2_BH10ACT2_00470 [soil metagenome]
MVMQRRPIAALRSRMHRFLSRLADQPVCYFKTPGNAGDALIHAGTMAAFDRALVRWDAVQPGDDLTGRTLLIGGGGNLTPTYDHVEVALRAFLETDPGRIIILPCGPRGHTSVLSQLRRRDLVICRDRVGYRHVRSIGTARVRLDHDMAFHLDAENFLNDQRIAAVSGQFLIERLAARGWTLQQFSGRPTMTFTRTGSERAESSPLTDIDISHELIFGDVSDVSPIAAWGLLECIRSSRRIVTDRLHVGIGAGLLGVPTELLANSYDKNRSVFDYSLHKLNSVHFSLLAARSKSTSVAEVQQHDR